MEQIRDIPTSVLATEGTDVKTGVLSILEKKGMIMSRSSDYQLSPLYWRLVSHAGQTYLLGYTKQLGGGKAIKKLLVKGCSVELNLPEKAIVSPHSNETFLCVQCGEKITFLKAESRRQRNKWVDAIRNAIEQPIYHPSTVSTTSSDSSDSFDVFHHGDQRPSKSVHNTADTAPRHVADSTDWKRANTTPAGQFERTNQPSVSSIPSSATALAQKERRFQDMASARSIQSELSSIHSLNSADRRRSSSQGELKIPGTNDDGAKIHGFEGANLQGYEVSHLKHRSLSASTPGNEPVTSDQKEINPYPCDDRVFTPDDHIYTRLQKYDDQSSVSRVNNLGLERGGNANVYPAVPELPKRDYKNQSQTIVVKEGLVKKKPSKKTRAPQHPEAHMYAESIQREKTVCLETQFQRDLHPMMDESNDDTEKEMHGKTSSERPKGESLHAYIQRFRKELFRKDGLVVEVDKTDLSPEAMKLICVADCICIAALPNAKLHSLLHVDDVIVKVNEQTLTSIDFCYNLFRTTDKKKVLLHVKRVMHGVLCHVTLSANGDVDSLGLEFGNQSQGNEVTAMYSGGLVAKNGSPSRSQVHGVVHGGILVNWGLVEINQSPVSFNSSPADVRDQIQRAGCELALVFIPMDLIDVFKERPCGESTEQTFKGEGTC